MFPKEQQALGPILTALSLWGMAPSGKNQGCDWRLGKVIPKMPGSGAVSEWLRLGTEVGSLQGCVTLVGSSLIALLSEHRVGYQTHWSLRGKLNENKSNIRGEGCLPERVWHRSCWSLFLFRKRLPRFSNLADVINFDFCQLATLPDHAWQPKYVPVYVRYLKSPYEGGHQCQPNACLVSFLYVGRTRFCRCISVKEFGQYTSEDWQRAKGIHSYKDIIGDTYETHKIYVSEMFGFSEQSGGCQLFSFPILASRWLIEFI